MVCSGGGAVNGVSPPTPLCHRRSSAASRPVVSMWGDMALRFYNTRECVALPWPNNHVCMRLVVTVCSKCVVEPGPTARASSEGSPSASAGRALTYHSVRSQYRIQCCQSCPARPTPLRYPQAQNNFIVLCLHCIPRRLTCAPLAPRM